MGLRADRPRSFPGRRVVRALFRRRVPAGVGGRRRGPGFPTGWDGWDGGDGGGTPVREPRRPRPSGPLAGGAIAPIPEPPVQADLRDRADRPGEKSS